MRAEFKSVDVAPEYVQGPAILVHFETEAELIAFRLLREKSREHGGIGILNWGGTGSNTTCLIGYQEKRA